MLYQTPTHLDHRSPVKIDINKTYFSTGMTRYNGQIGTQQRLQINLFKTTTTKGHQILQSITKPKYSNHKSKKGHDQQFCPLPFLFPGNRSKINFSGTVGSPTVQHTITILLSTGPTKGYDECY